jgi:uncharacterized protein (TIGR00369 family)
MTTETSQDLLPLMQRALAGEPVQGMRMRLPPPVATLIGMQPLKLERGSSVFRLQVDRSRHANPMGTLHGGIVCDVADAAMGMACASLLKLDESFTTVELKTNFFRPVFEGPIEARARAVHVGKSMVYLECDVVQVPAQAGEEKLVAKVASTCAVLRGDQAKGR